MIFTKTIEETFHIVCCYTCSLRFGITAELYRRAVTNASGSLYCPACGNQTIWQESEAQKKIRELEKKLEWEAAEVARQKSARQSAEASLQATRGVVTRLKARAKAGVCPCCHRTVRQMAQHMATKHPDFTPARA